MEDLILAVEKLTKNRILCWIGLIVVTFVLLLVVIPMSIAPVLHPDPLKVPSVMHTPPLPSSASAVEQARSLVRAQMSAENLPGLSVAVGIGQGIVWAEGFGYGDLKTSAPVTPDTRFRIGTVSTALTSAAVGMLIERGRLSLDDEIQNYVPQFKKKQWPITLRHLIANQAGVGTDDGADAELLRQRCERPVEALQRFGNDALLFEPGTQQRHSSYGWILVSAAVEAAAGQPFLAFMREQVFQPLGMHHTGAESSTAENPEAVGEPGEDAPFVAFIAQRILEPLGIVDKKARPTAAPATIYSPGFGGPLVRRALQVMPTRNLSCYAGSMAFFSTPSDLVRFGLAISGGMFLKPATVQLLHPAQQLSSGQSAEHGLGWDIQTVTLAGKSTRAIGQNGEVLGQMVASLVNYPELGMSVSVVSNRSQKEAFSLTAKIAAAFAGEYKAKRVTNVPEPLLPR